MKTTANNRRAAPLGNGDTILINGNCVKIDGAARRMITPGRDSFNLHCVCTPHTLNGKKYTVNTLPAASFERVGAKSWVKCRHSA